MVELVIMERRYLRINLVKWLVAEQSESGIPQLVINELGTKPSIIVGTFVKFVLS